MSKNEVARAWRYTRYDDRNTACTGLKGRMSAPRALWEFTSPDGHAALAVAADANMDTKMEVLVAGKESLYLVSGAGGKLIWQKPLTCHGRIAEVSPAAAIFDINMDGWPEVLVAAGRGGATAVSGVDGQMVWQHPSHGTSALGFGCMECDLPDVFQTDLGDVRRIYRVRGRDGFRVWETVVPGTVYDLPVAADLNGDGNAEIVFHSLSKGEVMQEQCICLDCRGEFLWSRAISPPVTIDQTPNTPADTSGAPVIVADFLGSGDLQVLCITNTRLTLINGAGEVVWERDTGIQGTGKQAFRRLNDLPPDMKEPPECPPEHIIQGAAVGDIDGDGQLEITVGLGPDYDVVYEQHPVTGMWANAVRKNISGPRNVIAAFKAGTGEPVWIYDSILQCPEGRGMSAPIIADVDGDGLMEVAAYSADGHLHVVRGMDGTTVWQYPVGVHDIGRVIFADINDDGYGELVVAAGDRVVALGPI